MPTNSAMMMPVFAIRRASITKAVQRTPKLLADKIGESLAGDDAHPDAHFLYDDKTDRHRNEGPEKRVAVVGAGGRIGGDSAGVVAGIGGDYPGPENGKIGEEVDIQIEPGRSATEKFRVAAPTFSV